MHALARTGYYGKLPSNGDFVSRTLTRSFIDPWDTWLQAAVSDSRARLGADWLDLYLTTPIWRFVLAPDVCGVHAYMGLLMPSVDRVGRYFPLTIAAILPAESNPIRAALEAQAWFEEAERLALSALDDAFERAAFDLGVDELEIPLTEATQGRSAAATTRHWRVGLPDGGQFGQAFAELLPLVMTKGELGYSLWWSRGSEDVEPSLLSSPGLPPPERYGALLDGCWSAWGWDG